MAANKADTGVHRQARSRAQADQGRRMVVWSFTDGKAGHENQTAGLLAALRERIPVDEHALPAHACRISPLSFVFRRFPCGDRLPDPDLIMGAGHATHLPMLAARRARGGRVIVLMKPSLPMKWFDQCVIPAHDRPRPLANVLVTRGVLNRVRYRADKDDAGGLFLAGGPSPHVDWSSDAVFGQIQRILEQSPDIDWQLATSRRTPAGLLDMLDMHPSARLTVVPVEETGPDWLPDKLASAACVWVTSDSVSMVYEALTSGAAVGLLSVPFRKENDRLAGGLQELQQAGLVTAYEDWRRGSELQRPAVPLDEAGRCADWILEQWPGKS